MTNNYITQTFTTDIKKWVEYDDKIQSLNTELKQLRELRNNAGEKITQHIETHNLVKTRININKGYIKYSKTYQTSPITIKLLFKTLSEFFNDEDLAKNVCDYVKKNRDKTLIRTIKRTNPTNKT